MTLTPPKIMVGTVQIPRCLFFPMLGCGACDKFLTVL